MKLILYTGPQCELCDHAVAIIGQLDQNIELEKVNVRDSTALYHLYGARIPVIKKGAELARNNNDTPTNNTLNSSTFELAWPFSLTQLKAFIA